MRVLLAIDGSVASDRARDLVAGIEWPEGSIIRVVGALEEGPELYGVPWMGTPPVESERIEGSLIRRFESALQTAERELEARGRGVERILLRGRAASAIVEEARDFRADLIVVGNRGHGVIETMLLGSVSAEVVDHAPCPVLVARGTGFRSFLYADDGSEGAREAGDLLSEWSIFKGRRVTVLSVSDVPRPWSAGMAPEHYDQVREAYGETVLEARREHAALADVSADRLADVGLIASVDVRDGDPAASIVKAAAEHGADCIVMGTRGHTGLTRLVLGSVARNVLLHAPCSVLVVREHTYEHRAEAPGTEADEAADRSTRG